ncbi:bola-like protein [Meira miltonrushii]|uniref:Bola-like protein n=1 Tax=Meira miltonrushii TaxID=1280837 RepID=A0A316VLZ6_9BASI|nr:bola-like protein [Meira miltonrushii]PWN37423.1 bola-like protein [Meira miltonrushii]
MVSQSELEAAIRQKVEKVSALIVSDVSGGCGQAYDVIIVSEAFEGLNTLKRHRMVNELLKEQIAELHAFSQKTYTPQQYEQLSANNAADSSSSNIANGASIPQATVATPNRPSTLDTSVAQRGAKVHHRTTSSNVSVPELILTPDAADESGIDGKRGPSSAGGHNRQRSLTPNNLNDMMGGSSTGSPNSASSGISRLHYSTITDTGFWTDLRDLLEKRCMREDASPTSAGATSPGALPNRQRGEAEMVKIFEDFFQSQKIHMSASDAARVRDGTGMFGM